MEAEEVEEFFNLVRMSNEDLEMLIEKLDDEEAALTSVYNEHVVQLLDERKELIQLQKVAKEQTILQNNHQDGFEKLSLGLATIQKNYNDLVDPYNEAKEEIIKIKENYQDVAKLYNERKKKTEASEDEFNKKVTEMDEKIAEARKIIEEKQQMMDSANKDLDNKVEILKTTRECRVLLESQVHELDIESLKENRKTTLMIHEEKTKQLQDVKDEINRTDEHGRQLNDQKTQAETKLLALQNGIAEGNARSEILDQQTNNSKNIVEKILKTKILSKHARIEQANLNLVNELQERIQKRDENASANFEMMAKKQAKLHEIENLKQNKQEKIKINTDLAGQLQNISIDDSVGQDRKKELKAKLQAAKQKMAKIKNDASKSFDFYNEKIKKEKRKQALYGFVDDDKASTKSSDESLSDISSSIPGNKPVEKTNFDTTFDASNDIA